MNKQIGENEPKSRPPAAHDKPARLYPPARSIAIWGPLLVVCLLAVLAIIGIWRHVRERSEEEEFANKTSVVPVLVATVHRDSKPHDLLLPGSVQAYESAIIYARVNGYLSRWYFDIGANVKEGELLAEIEAPDVDAQLRQASATLAQTRAALEIARLTFQREQKLLAQKVVSQQEYDQNRTTLDAEEAAVKAGEANVQNLLVQQGFEKIIAPFTGVITARDVDIGALVQSGGGSAGTQLFGIARSDPLRVYVNVPQTNVPALHEGDPARLVMREYPGHDFEGKLVHIAGALDPLSRTLLVEVDVPNRDGLLYAGMYGEVKFALTNPPGESPIIIPANTFRFDVSGPQVAQVTADSRIQWRSVSVGRDFGTDLEVLSGLKEGMKLVTNPTDDLIDGLQVQAKESPPAAPSSAGPSAGGAGQPTGSGKAMQAQSGAVQTGAPRTSGS